MSETSAVRYEQEIPDVLQAMAGVHNVMDAHGFDRTIRHLVQLRASQINGCAHCIKMHTREARQDGETNERLDRVIVWEHVNDFSEREKAADLVLGWQPLPPQHVPVYVPAGGITSNAGTGESVPTG